jgi:hypothetical protein
MLLPEIGAQVLSKNPAEKDILALTIEVILVEMIPIIIQKYRDETT